MKRLIIIILVLFSIFISACSTQPTPASAPQNIAAEDAAAVTIEGFSFSPLKLTVKKGTTVTWTNQDSAPHTVTSDSGSELASLSLSKGQFYSHTFNEVGTFEYHCKFHSMMRATVIVE